MTDLAAKIDWKKGDGMVPAIIQDVATSRVLMLGYMNQAALAETIRIGKVTFFSRSKNRLWTKGETSGHFLTLTRIDVDCDGDTLLVQARPVGPACHNGTETCFGAERPADLGFLGTLENVIAERAAASDEKSYVAQLLGKGVYKMAQKVGEEGVETALAGVSDSLDDLRNEAADLVFHLMILLKAKNLSLKDISAVLEARHTARQR